MATISVSKAWDETLAFIKRERRLISPVVLALVFLPTLVFRTFAPQPTMAQIMAGDYPAWLPWLSYLLLFVQIAGGAALILMALGSRDPIGATIVTGFKRAVIVLLAALLGALVITPVLIVLLIVAGLAGGMPTNPTAIPPGFMMIVGLMSLLFGLLVLRMVLFLPAAVAEPIGPWAALKRGWSLGRGNGGRLIVTMVALFLGSMVVNYAAVAVVGSATQLAFGSNQGPTLGGILVALVVAALGTAIFLVQYVLLAYLYRQAAKS